MINNFILKQIFKYKWFLLAVLILIIAEPSLNSVMNFLLQKMFDIATPGGNKTEFLRLLSAGFLLWMLKRVIIYSNGVIKTRFICNAKQDIKHYLFVKILGRDAVNISEIASSGEYVSIFTNDIMLLETRFFNQLLGLVSGLFSVAILGSSFVVLNVKLAWPIIGFGIISMFIPAFFSRQLNKKSFVYSESISKFTQKLKEYMSAYPTIKNYAIEQQIIEHFDIENNVAENAKFDADCTLTLADCIGQLIAWFMQLISVGLGLTYVIKGEILIGTVIAAQSFASDLAGPLNNIVMNINAIRSVKNIVDKLEKISSEEKADCNKVTNEKVDDVVEHHVLDSNSNINVVFDNFSLVLNNQNIIRNFSYCFQSGKKYLIVGLNGSGKSTLFKSLKKWYGVYGDSIRLNDVPLSNISNDELSRYVSYLNENVSLFSGSVKENITLFRECNAHVFFNAVENAQVNLNLERIVSEDGRNISSGEQRRIEIARSLLSLVKVIVFDEVVSTLDIETAYEIEKMALELKDKTVIFISHNFSGKLIQEYDEILVMQDGCLIGHGKCDELLKTCDYFKRICEIKFGKL